ncbi:MAG: hypothetical protein U1D30_06205 [Planctomycetota bacterium]
MGQSLKNRITATRIAVAFTLVMGVLLCTRWPAVGAGPPLEIMVASGVPTALPMDAASIGTLINQLNLTPDQQSRLFAIASKHQGNLNDPRLVHEIESILNPEQREKVRGLIRQYSPPMPPPKVANIPTAERPDGVFSTVFVSGTKDRLGRVLGGTEVVGLTPHQGKLYAATSVWKDNANRAPKRGAQILVLERQGGSWKLDREFEPAIRSVAAMESFSISSGSNDGAGSGEENYLFVAPLGPRTKANPIHFRKGHGAWQSVDLVKHPPLQARSFGFHRDLQTGEHLVFVACQPGGMFRGTIDSKGNIAWQAQAEFTHYSAAPSGFANCNGVLHVAIGSQVYRRDDASAQKWTRVFTSPRGGRGQLRGLTAIPSPVGSGQVLLVTQDGGGRVYRIDPNDQYQATAETSIAEILAKRWGTRPQYVVAARHGMLSTIHPMSANSLCLFGIEARVEGKDRPHVNGWETGGWIVIRRSPDDYEVKEIVDPVRDPMPPLISTRAMATSPFGTLGDPAIYCGGYNTDSGAAHDTGWIAQASIVALTPDE